MDLRPGERLDDLGRNGLRIIQHRDRVPFSLDPVLLAHFARVGDRDRVLDLGTGTGIIPLLVAGRHPQAHVTGVELQPDLADMASRSVAVNGLQDRVRIVCGDYRNLPSLVGRDQFDVVTMNPPYRKPGTGTVSPVPARATARHEVEGSLPEAVHAAAQAVRYGGRAAVVFLAERLADLLEALRERRLEPKRLRLVHPRAGRPAVLLLVEAVKGGGVGLQVLPPLVVYEQDQRFTPELQEIYDGV